MSEHILIVDDEVDMLKLLEVIITEKTDYRVTTTNNPLAVSKIIKSGNIDVIITDLRMPEMDGIQLLEAARQTGKKLPFIVLTAYGTIESAMEAMHKGAFDYITKPFHKDQILLTIHRVVKYRRLQQENKALKEKLRAFGREAV